MMPTFCSDKLVVSTSCSLMHTAVDLVNETKLDSEIKSWLAFAAQKVVEVDALAKALAGQKDEVWLFLFFLFSDLFTGPVFLFATYKIMLTYIHIFKCHLQAYFAANAAAQASRRSSPRVTNEEVQKAVSIWF